jgi:hypothetical protein
MEERKLFQQMVLEQADIHRQKRKKEKLDLSLTLHTKINSKWVTNL